MIRRRRRQLAELEQDEAMGLSGWLYTDLMLGLVVVFLGAVVVTIPAYTEDDEGNQVVVTTTTTTTIPVELCTSLYAPYAERNLNLSVRYAGTDDELKAEFLAGLEVLYRELNGRQENQDRGIVFDVSSTKIGLVLALSSKNDGENRRIAIETRERLFGMLPNIFEPQKTPFRDSFTDLVPESRVAFEVFPLVKSPC
jgi:hypothetical protein